MRLNSIVVTGKDGLKGQTFRTDLTGADLFVGPNGAGKSTRLLAIHAGLRGLAGTPTDTVREYIGPERPRATVSLDYGDRTLSRDLEKSRGKAVAASDAMADDIAGPHLVRWDLADFVVAADTARTKLLESACNNAGEAWTEDQVVRELGKSVIEGPPAEGWTDDHQVGKLLKAVPVGPPTGRWLNDALIWTRARYTESNAAQKQAAKAVEHLQQEQQGRVSGSLADAKAAEEQARAELSQAEAALQPPAGVGDAARHQQDGDRLANEYESARNELKRRRDVLADARKRLADVPPAPTQLPERVSRDALDAATADVSRLQAALNDAKGRHLDASARVTALRELIDRISGGCVACGHADPLDLGPQLEDAMAAKRDTGWQVEDAEADLVLADRRARSEATAVSDADELRRQVLDQVKTAQAAHAAADRDVRYAEERVTEASQREQQVLARLKAWQDLPVPAATGMTDAEKSNALAVRDGARAALEQAAAHREAVVRREEREASLQRAIAQRMEAEERFAQVKALGSALGELQRKLASAAYAPIEAAANELLEAAGVGWALCIRDTSDYGVTRGEVFTHFAALSDAERAITAAAMVYAFAALTDAPWKAVILDRMEVIDEDRIGPVLQALATMVEQGRIDNFVGAFTTTSRRISAFDAVTVHYLGDDASVEEAA